MLEFDIWDNLTYLKDGNIWYKQTFFENELLKYEDYLGNYWTPEFGEYLLPVIEFELNADGWVEHFGKASPIGQLGKYILTINYEDGKVLISLNSLYLGTKGKSLLDTGYVYAPYVPIQLEPTINGDSIMAMNMALTASCYNKKVVNSNYYGTITVSNPDTPFTLIGDLIL